MLAALVREGKLPPVEERLPDPPLVLNTVDEIGVYGGELRRALTGDIVQRPGVVKAMSESLLGWLTCELGVDGFLSWESAAAPQTVVTLYAISGN